MARKTQPLDMVKRPEQQDSSADHVQEPANNLVMESKIVAAEVQPRAQEEQHRTAERDYWRRELRIARWLNWITAAAVVGGIVSLIYIKHTLDATRIAADAAKTQAGTAQRQLELSERPWITVHLTLSDPIRFYNGQMNVPVQITMKNVGHSVAMSIWFDTQVVFFSHTEEAALNDFIEARDNRDALCEKMRDMADPGGGFTLFPEQEIMMVKVTRATKEAIERRAFTQFGASGKFIIPAVIGCTAYRDVLPSSPHVTGFVYSVSSDTHASSYLSIGTTYLVKDISLFPNALMGTYID